MLHNKARQSNRGVHCKDVGPNGLPKYQVKRTQHERSECEDGGDTIRLILEILQHFVYMD